MVEAKKALKDSIVIAPEDGEALSAIIGQIMHGNANIGLMSAFVDGKPQLLAVAHEKVVREGETGHRIWPLFQMLDPKAVVTDCYGVAATKPEGA